MLFLLTKIAKFFTEEGKAVTKALMLVVYPLPDKGGYIDIR